MNAFRPVPLIRSDDGAPVLGVEDISVAGRTLYLSAYDRRGNTPGGLFSIPIADVLNPRLSSILVQPLTVAVPAPPLEHPHGMDAHVDDEGLEQIAVIGRPGPDELPRQGPEIVVLWREPGAFTAVRRLRDPRLCNANEIISLAPDRFLITNDRIGQTAGGRMLGNVFRPKSGTLLRLDGQGLTIVAAGIAFANGVAADQRHIYVAATRGRALHIFDRVAIETATAPVQPLRTLPLAGAPDNMIWGEDGFLYIAAHPSLLRFALFRFLRGVGARSRVLRYDPATDEIATVADLPASAAFSGATAAVKVSGHLIVAAGWADGLAVVKVDS